MFYVNDRTAATMAPGSRAILAVALLLSACGGSESTAPETGFTLSAPASISVLAGSYATVTVRAARAGGFDLPIALIPENSSDIIIHGDPVIAAGETSTELGLQIDPTSAQSTQTLSFNAISAGQAVQRISITVNIGALAPRRYALALAPSSMTVVRGASAAVGLTVSRTGFTGAIPLIFLGGPPGMTYGITTLSGQPDFPITGSEVRLIASASAGTIPGTYQVLFVGLVTGIATETTTLTLTIQ